MTATPEAAPRGAIAWMVRNRVTPTLLMLVFLVGGLITSLQIKQEVFPDFAIDKVRVSVSYPDASPEEVEKGVILAVEAALRDVEGVKEVNSTATEGSAVVVADLLDGTDVQRALEDIRQRVDAIDTFPEDAKDPVVRIVSRAHEVLRVQLFGEVPDLALREVADEVRDRLLQTPGITRVELVGARDHEIRIEIPAANLRAYGLTLEEVATAVGAMAVEVPGGNARTAGGTILLRVADRREFAREFARVPVIGAATGALVRLGDIATVTDRLEEEDKLATHDGKPAIALAVYRVGDQTPIGVSGATRAAMAVIAGDLPPGVAHVIANDESRIYQQRLELLLKNAFMGLALVMLLLGAFLDLRLAFWVTMGIPTAFLGAILFLPLMDVSINMISMFAFILALGIVVDDAIVAGENIHEYRQRGMPILQAAVRGARDVAVPVVFSVLTNVVTFIPLWFVPGMMGRLFGVTPLVVVTVFAVSLVEALFILPAHLAHSRPGGRTAPGRLVARGQARVAAGLDAFVFRVYQPALRRCVAARPVVVAAAVALLTVTVAYVESGRIALVLMPRAESDTALATVALPAGAPLAGAEAIRDRLDAAARAIAARLGGRDPIEGIDAVIADNEIEVRVTLVEPARRDVSASRFTALWREATGPIPSAASVKFESDRGGPGRGAALTVELSHRDIATLERASADLAARLAEFPALSDIDDGSAAGKRQVSFHLRPEGISLGLTAKSVARQVRAAFHGVEALKQQRGLNEVTVLASLPEAERAHEQDIERFLIRTPAGTDVPLAQVADVSWGRAYTAITRRDGRRANQVTADVTPIEETQRILAAVEATVLPALKADYPGLTHDFRGRQADMAESLGSLMASFVLAVLALYALLAIPFGNFVQPAIVMTALPLGIVGAIVGHLALGQPLSVVSVMGIVALSGVVINDALVMIDYANTLVAEGMAPREAVIQAALRRFRPIMLTTLTTFGGLAPMMFETSREAAFMIPMAISLGCGILFATVIVLVFIPALAALVEDAREILDGRSEAAPSPGPAE